MGCRKRMRLSFHVGSPIGSSVEKMSLEAVRNLPVVVAVVEVVKVNFENQNQGLVELY